MPKSKAKPRSEKKKGQPLKPLRRRYCHFCKEKIEEVDYKDFAALRRFISDKGKIKPRRTSGSCRRHQRQVALAIKRAREMALLPYVVMGSGLDRSGHRRRP